jgi:hypothetical protein
MAIRNEAKADIIGRLQMRSSPSPAELVARSSVDQLRASKNFGPVLVDRVTSDGLNATIPGLEVYHAIAREAGFQIRVRISQTRRGYEHHVLLEA